uniref:HASPB2 protein n=1 Tax=Leishmania donovani TaxID=5661 RepID=O77300_LEIDO|nr:HASPB2 protein [Leishmania donovani]
MGSSCTKDSAKEPQKRADNIHKTTEANHRGAAVPPKHAGGAMNDSAPKKDGHTQKNDGDGPKEDDHTQKNDGDGPKEDDHAHNDGGGPKEDENLPQNDGDAQEKNEDGHNVGDGANDNEDGNDDQPKEHAAGN